MARYDSFEYLTRFGQHLLFCPKRYHLFTNKQLKDTEENDSQYVDPYSFYPPHPGTEHPTHQPFQGSLAPNLSLSPATSYRGPVSQPPYGFSIPNPPQYEAAGQQGYPTRFPSGAPTGPQEPWSNPLYGPSGHLTLCDTYAYLFLERLADLCVDDHVDDGGVPTGHNAHTHAPPYQSPLLDSQEPRQQRLGNEQYQPESRRPTITQTSLWVTSCLYKAELT
jgi:hypothetical protein